MSRTIALRWGDNDRYLGPFTYARDSRHHRPLAAELGTGYQEDERCRLRLSGFGHTLIVALPPIVKPARSWVDTSRHDWSSPGGGYWDTSRRAYGFNYHEGHLSVCFGRQTDDSSTEQRWGCFLPWTQWRHVRHSLYGLDGSLYVDLPQRRRGARLGEGDFHTHWERGRELEEMCPSLTFAFKDYDGEALTVTTKIEEREWRRGEGWFKWLSLFCPPKIGRSLDLRFNGETGRRKGSWKGGTLGHSISMLPGELHASAFERYCAENEMIYVGPVE